MNNTILKNGLVIHSDGQKREDILIENDKISAVGDVQDVVTDIKVIDCTNRLIFPGIIDAHTHMGIPIKGGNSVDDFESGSKSALNGGVTTIIDFTVLGKNQTLWESILERHKHAEKSVIGYDLHCNITRFDKNILKEIPKIINKGITSFKVFTTYKEAGMMLTYNEIEKVARVVSDNGGILMVHAEDNNVIEKASTPLIEQNLTDPKYHAIARPAEAEKIAVENIANIAEKTDCEFYIVHLNTARGLKIAKQSNKIFVETCPQYLLLDDSIYERENGQMFVASPPLRKPSDCEALWNGVIDGSVDVIATDHCPFMLKDKPKGIPFQNIPNGMGGVETLFPVMLAQFRERKIDLSRLVQLMSTNPAKIFNLYPQKGTISVGADANIVIVNPDDILDNWTDKLVSITDWNAYSEFPAVFPEKVFNRGKLIS
ncbi:amidohydrolase family protein [bacterium]|nr:amidohydrolase family protein [bacterium]